MIAATIPLVGVVNSAPLVSTTASPRSECCLLGNLNCFAYDFVMRQKISNVHLNFFVVEQVPTLPPDSYNKPCPWSRKKTTLETWISERVLKLTCTAEDMLPLADACGFTGGSFKSEYGGRLNKWDEAQRAQLMAELDAAYFHLYGIGRDDVDYILETFPIVKRKDKQAHGEYRTKRVILDIYDAMQQAMATGTPYHTRLAPPPANGWTPPEIPLEVVTGCQSDGAKEGTAANSLDEVQWRAESATAQPILRFEAPE